MTTPTQPKDVDLIRTWPNQWTQINHPPAYPKLVQELKATAKKVDASAKLAIKKDKP